jgi:hypothetical protein
MGFPAALHLAIKLIFHLRAWVPDIASHILSNHYTNTRGNYYQQLQSAAEKGDLTDFICYALEEFRDGLEHDILRSTKDRRKKQKSYSAYQTTGLLSALR